MSEQHRNTTIFLIKREGSYTGGAVYWVLGTDRIVQIGHIGQRKESEFWASGFNVEHSPTLWDSRTFTTFWERSHDCSRRGAIILVN